MSEIDDDRMPHPAQRVTYDEHGVLRFRANEIVRRLLDEGPFDMNQISSWDNVSRDDWRQFAQLIGYSVSGASGLSYMDTRIGRALIDDAVARGDNDD